MNLSTENVLYIHKHKNKDFINFFLFNFYNRHSSTAG
jgi:hypothetical protein